MEPPFFLLEIEPTLLILHYLVQSCAMKYGISGTLCPRCAYSDALPHLFVFLSRLDTVYGEQKGLGPARNAYGREESVAVAPNNFEEGWIRIYKDAAWTDEQGRVAGFAQLHIGDTLAWFERCQTLTPLHAEAKALLVAATNTKDN